MKLGYPFLFFSAWATSAVADRSEVSINLRKSRELRPRSGSSSFNSDVVKFDCSDSEATLQEKGAASVKHGRSGATYYIGTQQVSGDNQDPIVAMFENDGVQVFCRTDYEVAGADGRGLGLFSKQSLFSKGRLYAAFSIDGTQGTTEQDLRRFTQNGWLTGYGQGGGAKVSVVLEIDPITGEGIRGTYLRAQLSDGKTNTLVVTDILTTWTGALRVQAESYFHPLNEDGTRMEASEVCDQESPPFDYTVTFTDDLSAAESAVCYKQGRFW